MNKNYSYRLILQEVVQSWETLEVFKSCLIKKRLEFFDMKAHLHRITWFLAIWLVLQSCANYDLHYANPNALTANRPQQPTGKITHTMFLIGDAGNAAPGAVPPAVALLGDKVKALTDPENASVIYLGDNLYPNGFAPKREKAERAIDEHRLKVQLDIVKDFKGQVFFVAGNHDWYTWGIPGLKREREFIETYLGREDVWLPKPGCGDPIEVELNKDLVLILLDTEWWLVNWDGHTEINDGCDVKSRKMFQQVFDEAIKSNRHRNIVVAMHHPPYTYGTHGGQFTANDHLFPLTAVRRKLRVPLPGLGSVYPFMRSFIGSPQDIAYPEYKSLRNVLVNSARKNGSFIFASGHEHTLQYIERDSQSFIVSGSGSKISPVKLGEGSEFAYGYYGFCELNFYDNGAVWMRFWTPEGESGKGRIVFEKQIKAALPKPAPLTRDSFAEYLNPAKTVTKPLSQFNYKKTGLWRLIWGEHYREAYNTPIELPKLDLRTQAGGLKPTRIGGGLQTNSLRLEDEKGREYAIRSINKNPERTVPYPYNESFITDLIQDNFSATHPLGSLPAAKLSAAAGIYHTDPKAYYVPKQPALDEYNELFGNDLYLFEKRPKGDWSGAAHFGNAKEFESTVDVINKMTQDHDHFIDYPQVVRARLFDLLIGDWDRHDDQWRWAEFEQGKKKMYRPIPRDRDQAFSKYDGIMASFVRQFTPTTKQFRPYQPEIPRIKWASYNARHFDPTFLNALEWSQWLPQIQHLQQTLTDSVIENAFRSTFPPEIFRLNGEYLIETLKKRRDNLPNFARRHYEFVSRKVDVLGTEKREYFQVIRYPKDSVRVTVFAMNKDGDRQEILRQRTFLNSETREVRLYGLDGDDVFEVSGTADESILIRLIGGLGEDAFYDKSEVRRQSKRTVIYDAKEEKTELQVGREIKNRISSDPVLNTYVRKAADYEYNYAFRTPFLSVNPDDGLLLGLMGQYVTYGFKKEPYASRHALSGQYALATSGWSLRYSGEFINVFKRWDFQLDAQFNTPLYAINFYGLGNETPDFEKQLKGDGEEDDKYAENYVRVRRQLLRVEPLLLRRVNSAFSWSVGPAFESIRIDTTAGRLINDLKNDFNPKIFDGLDFLGVRLNVNVAIIDNTAFPTRGFGWNFDTGWKMQLEDVNRNFPFVRGALSIYQRLVQNGQLVFATRVGFMHNFNNKFEFYQGATLGSGFTDHANFRGVRRERFTGQSSFYHNNELRLQLLRSRNNLLPFALGVFGGLDYGRVWVPTENSKVWHYAYGGGVFFSPFNLITVNAGLFRSDDGVNRFTLGSGFFF